MSESIILAQETDGAGVPRVPYGSWLEDAFDWLTSTFSAVVDGADAALSTVSGGLADLLAGPDALVLALIFVLVGWLLRDWKMALLAIPLMVFIISADQWENAMETLALVAVAAVVALIIGIPLGVLSAKNSVVSNAVRPVMDLMQTMPALVWLIPAMAMFGLGMAAGIFATVIFALPPGVRLTELAIRQVDQEVVEAGHAFGSTPWQILMRIQLPLATKTIMAGVNQVIMLALSMAVFGGFVGAGGLGNEVSRAINTLDLGLGLEAGLCVVMLAIYLDRVTASIGSGGSLVGRLIRSRGKGSSKAAGPAPD